MSEQADAKALAAEHGASVVGSPYVPRGQMFLADAAYTRQAQEAL